MSKPTTGQSGSPAAARASRATATAPTMPPAGPERIVSLAWSRAGSARAPLEHITRRRGAGPRAARTWAR